MIRTTSAPPRTPRATAATASALAGAAAVALLCSACGASGGNAGAAARTVVHSARPGAAPYVLDQHGEENADRGRARRTPGKLALSEFTTVGGMRWTRWGPTTAVGTGEATGAWCLPGCLDKPLKATVTLADPRRVNGTKVFSSFVLELTDASGAYDSDDLRGKRPLATR
ncbi:hypothetical protein [Streptomyces sp. NPDC018031]|uniref:hypothetical protein n=1 Tax=Streptomyces sp. NPDC018031 TaxID=3365033 RepID=UPI0037B36819